MANSGFRTLAKETITTYVALDNILPTPINFSVTGTGSDLTATGPNTIREIQIQFASQTLGILSCSFDDGVTDFFLFNNTNIEGINSTTIFVDSTVTQLNFKFTNNAPELILWVAG